MHALVCDSISPGRYLIGGQELPHFRTFLEEMMGLDESVYRPPRVSHTGVKLAGVQDLTPLCTSFQVTWKSTFHVWSTKQSPMIKGGYNAGGGPGREGIWQGMNMWQAAL